MKLREMYSVNAGFRKGQFLILIDFNETTKTFSILALPKLADLNDDEKEKNNAKLSSDAIYISENDMKVGIDHKVLTLIEKLPRKYFNDCKNEFQYRVNIK